MNVLQHYGVKGMSWKRHKYNKIVNGQYVYDPFLDNPNDSDKRNDDQVLKYNKPSDSPLQAASKAYKMSLLESAYEKIKDERERNSKGPIGRFIHDLNNIKKRGIRNFADDTQSKALSKSIEAYQKTGKSWIDYLFK